MANKKRDRNGYRMQLGRYRLYRSDILAIEKILRIYADAREMQSARVSALAGGRKHMSRRYVDRHIKIGRYKPFMLEFGWNYFGMSRAGVEYVHDADSVKFLPKFIKKVRYVEVACWPGIAIVFTPLTTTIYAQTQYATGRELKVMKEVVSSIEYYLAKSPIALFNVCRIH